MDYDGDDFQSQNIQLVGEDNNRFHPLFQSVLKFDSLVETEGLLGIQGQGINCIEDFSLGGSVIGFSSSAAESCSISRHNVWSEATSSESVEMLLTSVREEEMMDQNALIKDAGIHDGSNSMEGTVPESKDENLVVDVDTNSIDEQLISERHGVADQCGLDKMETSSLDYPFEKPLVIDEGISQAVENYNPLHNTFTECATDDHNCIGRVVSLGNPNYITCSSKGDPSPVFTPNFLMCPGELNTRIPSEQVIEECCEIDASEMPCIIDNKEIDLPSQGPTENPDGLLEAATNQSKVLAEGNLIIDTFVPQTKEKYSLVTGDSDTQKSSVGISNEDNNVTELTNLIGGLKGTGDRGSYHLSENYAAHVQSTLSTERNTVVGYEGCEDFPVEVFKEKHEPEIQQDISNYSDSGNTSNNTKEMLASVDTCSALLVIEAKDPNLSAKSAEGIVKQPEFKLNVLQGDTSAESQLPALPDDVQKTGFSIPCKSFSSDVDKLVVEQHDVHKIPTEVLFVNADTIPIINSSVENSNASSAIQESISTRMDFSSANNFVSEEPAIQESMSTRMDVFVERKEANTPPLIASGFIQHHDKKVEASSLETQISKESAEVFGLVLHDSPMKDLVHDEPGVRTVFVNNSIIVQHSESEGIMMVDVAIKQKEQATSVIPASECIPYPQNENEKSSPSGFFCSMDIPVTETLSGLAKGSGSGKDSPSVSQDKIQPIVGQFPSSVVEGSVDVGCGNKIKPSIDDPVILKDPTGLEGNMCSHSSIKVEGSTNYSSRENEETTLIRPAEAADNSERQVLPVPPLSNRSSSGDFQSTQEIDESNVAQGDNYHEQNGATLTEDDIPSCHATNSSESLTMTRNVELNVLEDGNTNLSSFEQNCGSPTIISCNERSRDAIDTEGNNGLLDHVQPLSNELHVASFERRGDGDKLEPKAPGSKESILSEDDRSFTFEVGSARDLSERDTDNEWKSFHSVRLFEPSQVSKEISESCPPESTEMELHQTITKTPDEDKFKDEFGCSTEKSAIPEKTSESDGHLCNTLPKSIATQKKNTKLDDLQHYPHVETSVKASCTPMVQTFSLPDLNNLVSAAGLFHQPFTDQQQVQLRAQIFVYGSLIQGVPPDEACMISAFGDNDGGRNLWEVLWSVSLERSLKQNSPFSKSVTPHSRTGIQISEKKTRFYPLEINPIPSPSPQWRVPTHDGSHQNIPRVAHLDFSQAVTPLHSHQSSSQIRQLTGNNVSWLSQSPRPGTWIVPSSQSSSLVAPVQYSAVPIGTPKNTKNPGNMRSSSTVQKSRKKKKAASMPEELQSSTSVSEPVVASQPLVEPVPANSPTKVTSAGLSSTKIACGTENRDIFTEETASKIHQAKLLAEEAASLAASTVEHSQAIWNQLETRKKSGFISESDEKLVSAAVAAAAAAAVAKAAAAAARVASEAALQAHIMSDEALISTKTGFFLNFSEAGILDVEKNLTKLMSVPILEGNEKVHGSGSVISVAREAARKRLELTSSAAKRAENLDAIVKAAEIAAEAVSQAGTIIAMGDPLPFTLSELVKAGPEGHWKLHNTTANENMSLDCDKHIFLETKHNPEKHQKGNGLDNAPTAITTDSDKDQNTHEENIIQKGSLVEVVSDEDGLGRVWYSTRVLEMDNRKAYVCYNGHLSNEGSGPLKEWISLEVEGDKAPRIRLTHPLTQGKYEVTRKRRREDLGNYAWAVGDRVDAWIRDGWREGIIMEMSQDDDTKLTVRFSAGGDSSIVRAWDVRYSLVWKDGQWIEWSRARENVHPYQGDTPQEKRQKLSRLEVRAETEIDREGICKASKNVSAENSEKLEVAKPLNLSDNDRTFCIGNNADNLDPLRVRRTGLQKGGPKVIFGVPKPGKKRKFMEVSKHYVADKTKNTTEGNESVKFAKYLMPQTSSHVWRNFSKVDSKGNIAGDSRPKAMKSVMSHTIQTRSVAEKDNATTSTTLNIGENTHRSLSNTRTVSNGQKTIGKKREVGSLASKLGRKEDPDIDLSVQPKAGVPSSSKKSTSFEADMIKGKSTLGTVKPTKSENRVWENPGNTITGAPEPRRSNRRIQPTSRLLEGLQSSLIVSKIPSMSHDKGNKGQQRAASSRGNTHD